VIIAKTQPLILDGTPAVRAQLLKLFKSLPPAQLGPLDGALLYSRAGMTHLSTDIRLQALDTLDWLLACNGEAVVSCAGGWVKTLKTFQNLLSWNAKGSIISSATGAKWSNTKASSSLGSNKLLVHQINTLTKFLNAGLKPRAYDPNALAVKAAQSFPLWHTDAHTLPTKSNCYGYLNLFGAPRDLDSEMYDDPSERVEALHESGLYDAFKYGVEEAKKEAGEIGRAASGLGKALRFAEQG
jgi:pre-rRNA-processing protein IPI1